MYLFQALGEILGEFLFKKPGGKMPKKLKYLAICKNVILIK